MSIDTELIVQILKRSPQGLTPFEILDHLINEPQYQGFSKPSIFSKRLHMYVIILGFSVENNGIYHE